MYERTVGSPQLESVLMWQCIEEVYHLGHVICNGRMGTVIKKATHRRTGAHYAMKVIRVVETAGQGISRARALKEAHLISLLEHPNIIRLFGVYESIEEVVLILEYCDGGDLLDLLTKVGRFAEHEAKRYFSEVLSALVHMHQKRIAHRDIKLDNLGLSLGADRQWHVKLLDFGFSDTYDPETRMTLSCGTLEYAAPELLRPVGKVGYRGEPVDVWSAGCVLFAFVCGHLPFQAGAQRHGPTMEWPSQVQGSLRDLLASMLLHNPRERVPLRAVATAAWLRGHEPHLHEARRTVSHVRSHSHSQSHSAPRQPQAQLVVPWARPAVQVQAADAATSCCQAG